MSKAIQKLGDDLINKIAAGEVVERPASVVKELVENALDAGSTRIVVRIQDGGKKSIQVVDNGSGIHPDELSLAVDRHATSKIHKFDDLYSLSTNGFRGEALASIASVSQARVASKTQDEEASEIVVHAGRVIDQRACAQPQGTTVEVKFLFYQTPARLKFLRTAETETSHIVSTMTKLALSYPHVEFSLYQGDKELLNVPVFSDEKKRVVHILGKDLENYLYPFSAEAQEFKIHGFFGHPNVARSQRTGMYLFVNGRPIQDKMLWHAIRESYRDLLMVGKYPVLVMHLWVDERTLDVNVHPTKSEVRFHHSNQVHSFVKNTLRNHLQESPWLEKIGNIEKPSSFTDRNGVAGDTRKTQPELGSCHWENVPVFDKLKRVTLPHATPSQSQHIRGFSESNSPQRRIQFGKTPYADMRPLSQFLGTYILCEAHNKLVLIDQHAAHERVGFEKLMLQFQKDGIPNEPLLVPISFDLKPSDAEIFKNFLAEMLKFGFEIDFFGGNTFVLKAEPVLLKGKIDFQKFIVDLIEDIKETGEMGSLKDKWHHVLATMACHGQIRAHHHLTQQEMQALLNELEEYQFTDFCPHGRPVSIEVTLDEIEKWFRRTL